MELEWRATVCILVVMIEIIIETLQILEWFSLRAKDDIVSQFEADQQSWPEVAMDGLFVFVAFLLIFGVAKNKRMLMLPFVVVVISFTIVDICYLIDYFYVRLACEAIVGIIATITAIIVFFDMGGIES